MSPSEVIETNIEHRNKLKQVKLYSESADTAHLSEKILLIEVLNASFGFNPASGKFDLKVQFNKDISTLFKKFENLMGVELMSGYVNILPL